MTVNTPNLDLATINTYIEYGEIPPICSQDIEQKRDSDINHGPKLKAYIQSLVKLFPYWAETKNPDINQGP